MSQAVKNVSVQKSSRKQDAIQPESSLRLLLNFTQNLHSMLLKLTECLRQKTNLQEAVQEEREPVSEHLLSHRLSSAKQKQVISDYLVCSEQLLWYCQMVVYVFWVVFSMLLCGCLSVLGYCQIIAKWLLKCFGWLQCWVVVKAFWVVARALLCSC